jgi:transcriptional regulator GlxA family with amidase domain
VRFVWRELQRENSPFGIPRVAHEAEEMLAAMFAEACVHGEFAATVTEGDGHAGARRRAEEFLAAQMEKPVSLAEVANLAGVSTKTLTRIFRRQHGVGPMAFLRRRRLEAARGHLLAAAPGQVTVSDVALRYGFEHHGRFAASYREAFGERPSETLSR